MIETKQTTPEHFDEILRSKLDLSWSRYDAGWVDVKDRYDLTVALLAGESVLDIGCAESLLAHLVAEKRPDIKRVVGVDACDQMITRSRQQLPEAELYSCYAEDIPFDVHEFDTVVLGQTLEHVYEIKAVINEAVRVLKDGGRLIVNVPADDKEPKGNHLRVFESIDDLKNLFGTSIFWQGWAMVHRFYFAWGVRI